MAYRVGSKVDVEYPRADTSGISDEPTRVVLIQEVNRHDVLVVDHPGSLYYLEDTLRSGSPVQFSTTSARADTSWFGYVNNVTPSEAGYSPDSTYLNASPDAQDSATTQVVCVGTTFPFKKALDAPVTYETTSDAVTRIIRSENLLPFVSSCDMTQTVPQVDRSAWQVITELARISGRLVFNTGTTVNWLSPDDIMTHYAVCAPTLSHISQTKSALDAFAMPIWEVDVTDNNSHDDQSWRSETLMVAVDPVTGTVLNGTVGDGMFSRRVVEVARSRVSLKTKMEAAYNLAFSQSARLTGPGNPYVAAGRPVFVKSPDGYQWWLVRKVEHVWFPINRQYRMQVTLMAHDGLPQPTTGQFPQVSMSRKTPYGSPQLEYMPVLTGGAKALVTGTGKWGIMDRWKATTHV